MIKQIRTISKTRISKKIISVVVTAIILSSTCFMIPELYVEKKRILKEVEASAKWITDNVSDALNNDTPPDSIKQLFGGHQVMGYQICDSSGCQIQSGETITGQRLSPSDATQFVFQENDKRLEITLSLDNQQGLKKQITYRIDTAVMDKKYWIHFFTIMAEILGISICAILTAMLTTNMIIIVPALKLKQQMMQAKQDPDNPTKYLLKVNQDDEIADLIGEFNSMLHDIENYQNQLNQAKRDSDVRWKFAIEGSGDGIWDWNPVTEAVFFSPQTIQCLGYESGSFVHSMDAWQDLIHPDERAKSIAALHAHMQSETTEFSVENRIRHHDGGWVWVLSRA